MGEFRDTLQKRYMTQDNKEADSKFRANGSGLTTISDASDVPDALRNTREVLDLVVACMVALLLIVLVVTVIVTIVTRLVDLFKQRKQMKANFGPWRSRGNPQPSSRPLSQMLMAHSPLTSPKSTPLPPTGPYRAVPKPPAARVLHKMVPPSAPPAEQNFLARA